MTKAFFIFLFISSYAFSQLTIGSGLTPDQYVNNHLVGTGVNVSNVTFVGQNQQIGHFNQGELGIGLEEGLVMSTGAVSNITNSNILSLDLFTPGDNDILNIAQSVNPNITSSHDAAVLEFDFVPAGDSVQFNFVFASEEYTIYECDLFNDAFGFFIDGAKPGGGTYNHANLALIPGTTTPITVSTVYALGAGDCATNSYPSYYQDGNAEHGFNGYLIPIEVKFAVTCGSTYHFKFAIADCQDGLEDSGIFLESGSFSSNHFEVAHQSTNGANNDLIFFENCPSDTVNLQFTRITSLNPDTIRFNIGGSAINGVDYELIPDSVIMPAGVDTVLMSIKPINDGITEGLDSILFTFSVMNDCGVISTQEKKIFLNDGAPPLSTDLMDITYSCPNAADISIAPNITGAAPFTFNWMDTQGNSLGTNNQIDYTPTPSLINDTLILALSDLCQVNNANNVSILDTVIFTFDNYDTVRVNILADTIKISNCLNLNQLLVAEAQSGNIISPFGTQLTGTYTFHWSNGISAQTDSVNYLYQQDEYVYVYATDDCGIASLKDSVYLQNIAPKPVVDLAARDTVNCPGTVINIIASATGGTTSNGNYTFQWDLINDTDDEVQITVNSDTTVYVKAIDECFQSSIQDSIQIVIVAQTLDVEAIINKEKIYCAGDSIILDALVHVGQPSLTNAFEWSKNTSNNWNKFGKNDIVDTPNETTTYTLTFRDQCGNIIQDSAEVVLEDIDPVSIEAIDDITKNCPGDVITVAPEVSGGTPGENSFSWNNGSGDSVLVANPSNNTQFELTVTDACGTSSTTSFNVIIPPVIPLVLDGDNYIELCRDFSVNSTVIATGGTNGIASYSWNINGLNVGSGPSVSFPAQNSGTLNVTVTDNCGFQQIWPIDLVVNPCEVIPPNVVTPNGDGVNDTWVLNEIENFTHRVTIYNRWGTQLYESTNFKNDWSATGLQDGVYFYVIELKERDEILEGSISIFNE